MSDIVFKVVFGKPENIDILAKLFGEQLKEGERYSNLPRAITLNILDFNLLSTERFLNRYRFLNTEDYNELSNLCEINFLELKKVPIKCYMIKRCGHYSLQQVTRK